MLSKKIIDRDDFTQAVSPSTQEVDLYEATKGLENTRKLSPSPQIKYDNDYDSDDERAKNAKLFLAIRKNKIPKIVKLLDSGVNVNTVDKNNKDNTPLHLAIEKCRPEVLELLLDRQADLTLINNRCKSALQLAVESGNEEIIKKVTYRTISLPAVDGSCLFSAVTLAYLIPVKYDNDAFQERFQRLFGVIYSTKLIQVQKLIQACNLFLSIESVCDDKVMRRLVTKIFRNRVVDQISFHKSRFLDAITVDDFFYSRNEYYVTRGLLQKQFCRKFKSETSHHGIDINKLRPDTFNEASMRLIDDELNKIPDQLEVQRFKFMAYLECMRNYNAWGGNHELQAISLLLHCSVHIFSRNTQHFIQNKDSQDQIQLFYQDELYYNFGIVRASVLIESLRCSNFQEAKTYLKFGVDDVNYEDHDRWTALHFAAQRGHLEIVQLLLAQGADTAIKNNNDQTALCVAKEFKRDDIVRFLKHHSNERILDEYSANDISPVTSQPEKHGGVSNKLEQSPSTNFNKRPGTSGMGGQLYEIQLLMLFLLEGVRKMEEHEIDGFHLATNLDEAGDFDDVIFKYKYTDQDGVSKSKIIFLQAKHRETAEKEKITVDKLLSDSEKGDFNLKKYFKCYNKIKEQFSQTGHPLFDDDFEYSKCDFIIYTNALPAFSENDEDVKKRNVNEKSILFLPEISESKHFYQLIFHEGKKERIFDTLQYSSDSRRLGKALATSVFSSEVMNIDKGILKDYHIPITQYVMQRKEGSKEEGEFRNSFLNHEENEFRMVFFEEIQKKKEFSGKSCDEIKFMLQSKSMVLPSSFGKSNPRTGKYPTSLPADTISITDVKQFLNSLKLFLCQPSETELSKIIKQRIQSTYQVEQTDLETVFSDVKNKVEKWWKDGSEYLNENNRFYHESMKTHIWFDVRDPVELFTGREKHLTELHEALIKTTGEDRFTVISQTTSIGDMGGIGKTELAKKYIHVYAGHFGNNIIWINAESHETLSESFRRLAQARLRISTQNIDGVEKDIKSIVDEVYAFFTKRKSLFVFDNAEKYDTYEEGDAGIATFLPLLPLKNRPLILVTSRFQEWGERVEKVLLDVFTEAEAGTYIKKALCINNVRQDTDIKELAQMLQYFPLAVHKAVMYIIEENKRLENVKESFSITDYIKKYQWEVVKAQKLQDLQFLDNNAFARTIFFTWKITLEKEEIDYKEVPLDIIDIIAYFAPSNHTTKKFLKRITDRRELGSTFQLLKEYSAISLEEGEDNTHRLFQEVLSMELQEKRKGRDVLRNALSLVKKSKQGDNSSGNVHALNALSQCFSTAGT